MAADYRLAPGDKIEVRAVGVSDFSQAATVATNGEVSIALIGTIKAAGLTIRELEDQTQQLARQRTFRLIRPGTNEFMTLDAQDVSVRIAEYRPVFLSGDVGKPGSQPFSPGLTNRQAISVAGGCDLTRFGVLNPVLTSSDIRKDYERAWIEFATEGVRLKRLEAELESKSDFDVSSLGAIPLSQSLLESLKSTEKKKLEARQKELQEQQEFYEQQRAILTARIKTLNRQKTAEEQGLQFDEDEVERIKEQARTGLSPINRIAEARRVSLISATRVLQIGVASATAEREKEQSTRDGEAVLSKRREDVLTELQDARAKFEAARADIQSAGDKLIYTGLFRSQMSRGYGDPELTLFRKTDSVGVERVKVGPDAEMLPGDVLEVRCPFAPEDLKAP